MNKIIKTSDKFYYSESVFKNIIKTSKVKVIKTKEEAKVSTKNWIAKH